MASAAVRMFKVNPSTGAYDAVDGGGLLGCVMMGTGLTFQILVYNGQKVPQATVGITGTFDYTLRDLYMSFADSAGNQWSLLFDSAEVSEQHRVCIGDCILLLMTISPRLLHR